MLLLKNRVGLIVSLVLSSLFTPLSSASESPLLDQICAAPDLLATETHQRKLHEARFDLDEKFNEFLIEKSICAQPEQIFEHKFSNNQDGLVKIQAVCNVLTVYIIGEHATNLFFRKRQALYHIGSFVIPAIEPSLFDVLYGSDKARYGSIKRDDLSHYGKHRDRAETQMMHGHIEHKLSAKINADDLSYLSDALEKAKLITSLENEELKEAFATATF